MLRETHPRHFNAVGTEGRYDERVNARRARSKFARGKEQEDGIILLQTNLTRRPTNFVLHLSVVIVLFFYAKDNPQGK